MSGRKCGCDRVRTGDWAAYIRMAASSPVWFTLNAEERNSCCSCESGRIGLPSFCFCSEGCECGDSDCEGGGCGADIVLDKRDVWRVQHVVPGARKSSTGYWKLRRMTLRDKARGESKTEDILQAGLLYNKSEGEMRLFLT
jgi:hypothetical protein